MSRRPALLEAAVVPPPRLVITQPRAVRAGLPPPPQVPVSAAVPGDMLCHPNDRQCFPGAGAASTPPGPGGMAVPALVQTCHGPWSALGCWWVATPAAGL